MTRLLTTTEGTVDLDQRHPSVANVARYFEHAHLPEHLQVISAPFTELATRMLLALPDGPELTVGRASCSRPRTAASERPSTPDPTASRGVSR